jgi:hypothetical protein
MVSPVRLKKTTAHIGQRDFPFVVQIVVPDGGFGCTLDAINAWHHYWRNTQRRGPPQRFGEREFWSWGFEGLEIAKSFRHRFGGGITIRRRTFRQLRNPSAKYRSVAVKPSNHHPSSHEALDFN